MRIDIGGKLPIMTAPLSDGVVRLYVSMQVSGGGRDEICNSIIYNLLYISSRCSFTWKRFDGSGTGCKSVYAVSHYNCGTLSTDKKYFKIKNSSK